MRRETISSISSLLQKLSTLKELKQLQALLTKNGLTNHSSLIPKLITFTALSPSGSLDYAQAIFEETTMEDPFLCNTMIRAYSHSVFPIKAIHIYNQMYRMNVKSDNFTYPFVLRACSKLISITNSDDSNIENSNKYGLIVVRKGGEIHCSALKLGFESYPFVQNSLIYMYSRCGYLDLARYVFDEMSERTITSWNTMISAYDRINDFKSANLLFELIPEKNIVSWNTQIGRYVKLGDIESSRKVFEEMPERDAVSWNSMIAGYVQIKDYKRALEFFREMQVNEVEPTEITLISVLGACAETGSLVVGREIHEFLKLNEFKIEGFLGGALVDMYAKCGNLYLAREVFNSMKLKHVSCWNSMIMALAVHGYSEEALELFSGMKTRQNEAKPNRITFIGVLIACSHNGLVEEGRYFFRQMIEEYGIKPDMKHYGCMVDLLSRWGLLEDAHEMIKTMPFYANSVLWRTLLGACRVHTNVVLAEEAFRKLANLEPLTDGDYVLLSNIYAESERWDDVERVRNEMIGYRVSKKPGSSNIDT